MKKVKLILTMVTIGLVTLTTTSCSKEEGCTDVTATNYSTDADEDDGSCTFNGKVTFWVKTGTTVAGNVTVTLNSQTGVITNFWSSTPDCSGDSRLADFEMLTGTYPYSATDGTNNWSGNVTITKNGCLTLKLN